MAHDDVAVMPWRSERSASTPGLPAWSTTVIDASQVFPATARLPKVTPSWAWGASRGAGVRICIMDSGVDGNHPLIGPVAGSWETVAGPHGEPRVVPCDPVDQSGHGTACAGIIRQLAPESSIYSLRVLAGRSGQGAALLAGLRFAIDQGFDIVNLSLATSRPELRSPLAELADIAYFRRTMLVVSANNLPIGGYPWEFASVISVASHDGDTPMEYHANLAPPVEFHARGVRVLVAKPGGGTSVSTGNSFAAPHIAGIASLILSKHPYLTPFQLKGVLFECAANISKLGEENSSDT